MVLCPALLHTSPQRKTNEHIRKREWRGVKRTNTEDRESEGGEVDFGSQLGVECETMSYDLYCYRSSSNVPNVKEAQDVIESLNADEEAGRNSAAPSEIKERVVAALMQHNPRLERFQFDYRAIAEADNIPEAEARTKYRHVELNPPEGDLAIQLVVYDDHVFVTIPYWYGRDTDRVFSSILGYLHSVRKTAEYFVYDPQTDKAFDPESTSVLDHSEYDRVMKRIPEIVAAATNDAGKETLVEILVAHPFPATGTPPTSRSPRPRHYSQFSSPGARHSSSGHRDSRANPKH